MFIGGRFFPPRPLFVLIISFSLRGGVDPADAGGDGLPGRGQRVPPSGLPSGLGLLSGWVFPYDLIVWVGSFMRAISSVNGWELLHRYGFG